MDKGSSVETRKFAAEQADKGLRRLAFEISHGAKSRHGEAVHDLRVAIRRFSQTLRVFKACFRGKEPRKIRRELKRIMLAAGEVRNCDIALKILSNSKLAARIGLPARLQSRRRECERPLVDMLKRWLDRKFSHKWRTELKTSVMKAAQDSHATALGETAQHILPRMTEVFFKLGGRAARSKASPAELHQFRIALKKFRYSLDLFTPLYGPALNSQLDKIKHVQGLLGDVNDYETVQAMIAQYKGVDSITAWLKRKGHKRVDTFQKYWGDAFGTDRELRNWISLLTEASGKSRVMRKPVDRSSAISEPTPRKRVAAL